MTDEKKKQLFPYFAYLYSQQLNPEKYSNTESIEEWTSLLQESPEDIEEITSAASGLSDDDWAEIEAQYNEEQSSDEVEMAKKGAKLKKLKEFKKGAKMGKKKKCACGCDLISKKEFGGTIVDTCTCCGGVHKHQEGGIMKFQNPSGVVTKRLNLKNEPYYIHSLDKYLKFDTEQEALEAYNRKKSRSEHNQQQWDNIRSIWNRGIYNMTHSKNPDYVPPANSAVAQAERKAHPSAGNFDATQSPHYFGNAPVWQVAQQVQVPSNPTTSRESTPRTSSNTPQGAAPALTPTPETAEIQSRGGTGGAPQKVTTPNNKLPSTSGAVRIPSGNNAGRVPTQSSNQKGNIHTSVVDYLNSVGENSSFSARKQLASALGIQNYAGSGTQNVQLLDLLKQGKGSLGALKQNIVHNPVIAPISEEGLASMQSKKVPTIVAANRKGGLIKKAQKGIKTKEKYIGNNETWEPKNVGTGDNSMNPKDWSPEKKKADREAWLNRNKKVTKKPVPSKKVELPKRNK